MGIFGRYFEKPHADKTPAVLRQGRRIVGRAGLAGPIGKGQTAISKAYQHALDESPIYLAEDISLTI